MPTPNQDQLEERIIKAIEQLEKEFADHFDSLASLRWAVTRGLIHRAVHYAVEKPGVEFCALASYLGEQVGHAHKLAHGDNPKSPQHKEFVH